MSELTKLEIVHVIIAIGAIIELVDKAPKIPGMIKSIVNKIIAILAKNNVRTPNFNPNKTNTAGLFGLSIVFESLLSGFLLIFLPFGIYLSGAYSTMNRVMGVSSALLFFSALMVTVFEIINS